ncbi:MAG: sensor histidine kinase [Bacillota bacterium]
MLVVRFVYGLSFFTLGLVVSLQQARRSRYSLASGLWALAAFAFLHAFADWGLVFIPLRAQPQHSPAVAALWGFRTMVAAVSFGFLMYFGASLLAAGAPRRLSLVARAAAPLLTGAWLLAFFAYPLIDKGAGVRGWYLVSEVWSRYLLGLPASLAVAAGLLRQTAELRRDQLFAQVHSLRTSAAFFALYGAAAGLVVPAQGFWPASVLNTEVFVRLIGVPIELFRAAAAIGTAYYTSLLMGIFRIETTRRLTTAEQEKAVYQDRERIARDLHDGVLQTLYGVGLGLRWIRDRLPQGSEELQPKLDDLAAQLGGAVQDLRHSILGLREKSVPMADLRSSFREVAEQVARLAHLTVHLETEGLDPDNNGERLVPAAYRDHLLALLREGLSNAARHSGTDAVQVMLALEDDTLIVRVVDQGAGFDPTAVLHGEGVGPEVHHGLRNMRARTEQLGGSFRVDSEPGKGTRLLFQIPVPALGQEDVEP